MKVEDFYGYMVSAQRWRELIKLSSAPATMKRDIIRRVERDVIVKGEDVIDSFKLGLVLALMEEEMITVHRHRDFLDAIRATRDLNNLPYVSIRGQAAH